MYDNKVWTLVDLPDSRKAVENKWIFKRKTDADGNITVYKARLVAKGFRQIQGVDYDETFSPVAKLKSVRILLAIAAFFDYEIWQMDVKTAFLNGDIEEELYMVQPKGFVDPKNADKVCKLQRSIYGLKQASRSWNLRFDRVIKDFGFIRTHVSWSSSKQCTVAKSSTESDIAASEASSEAVWMKRFIVELGVVPSALDPLVIYCDNTGAIANAKEPRSHKKLKHIKLRFHSIREYIEDGEEDLTKGYSRLCRRREKRALRRAGSGKFPPEGEIDAIAIVIERDIISIIIIIISTIYTAITTAAPPYIEKTPFPAKMKEYSVISSAVNKSEKKPKEPEEQIKIEPAVAIVKDLVTENVEDGHIIFCEDASNIVSHPNKSKQVSVPMLSVRIGDHCYYGLCDIGASVSAIPYELYTEIMHEIGSCELEDIDVVIHLANRETISPIGIVRDVEVLCGKIKYPADFLVLGSAASDHCPIIFGRPFLNTCGAIIDCKKEKILTRFAGEPYEFNFSKFTKTPYKADLPSNDFKMEQCASIVLVPNNPLQQHLENSESEAFRKERDELEEIFLRQPILKHDLPVEDLGTTPPPKEDPVFDLKPLPDNLKYAHIDDKKIYPVIISSKLSEIEEERLLEILKKHRGAIGYTLDDLKGISPSICQHAINMEEDAKPVVEHQRRLIPKMKEVLFSARICFGSRSTMSSSGTQKDSFFEDVVNPYMNELKMHPKELQLVDGELQIKDVQGPKGEGSLEDRMEKLEQEVFNYKKMAEREVDIFHKIVSELIDGHKKETAKLWDDIFSLHDTTNKLQAQLYDVHNQNCEYENRFKRISHAASFRFPETKMSFVDGGPLPWKSDDDKDSPSSPKE
ncbi:hypothetical protein QYE76_025201 [Lolium multiflorum]|uniref:Reverse transcriptase Ty1/copia-type domain-containing protein n=1 Tax=Lolium multiflorum TaxID=4521 RepID=A0AAD8VUF3_LOLMU|nr:hypothetical protein QYE76_025201 [Lolium multiflorum]